MSPQALIVEDDPQTGEALAEILRHRGFVPTVLPEGRPAVPWVRQHRPDIVLLDLILPDIDGHEVCEGLKFDRTTNLIPVIMVTARSRAEDRYRGLRVGANAYLTKPFSSEQLDAAIREALTCRDRLQRHGAQGEIRFHLRSDTRYLQQLNDLLASLLHFTCLEEEQVRQLTTAMFEMGANAIEWGHRKQVERVVTVTYRIDPDRVTIVIRDTGPGFNPRNLPHAAHEEDPVAHMEVRDELGLRAGGFGIMMTRGLVDDLKYNATGNEVTLVKHCPDRCSNAQ